MLDGKELAKRDKKAEVYQLKLLDVDGETAYNTIADKSKEKLQ